MSTIRRKTRETEITVRLQNGAGTARVDTEVVFLDHMLETLARFAGLDLEITATGDLRHHLIEDVAITLGLALKAEIPPTCNRYGESTVAMDDALVQVVLDAGGRSFYRGPLPLPLSDHFLRSLADNAGLTLHVRVLRGCDRHHIVEAAFKALGLSLRQALQQGTAVFSTKGAVQIEQLDCELEDTDGSA